MDPISILSAAVLATLAWRALRESNSHKKEKEDKPQPFPEYLNFKVNQEAIDRLRDPTIPTTWRPFADEAERASWLLSTVEKRVHLVRNEMSLKDGLVYEYDSRRTETKLERERNLREFARLGFEVQALSSVNLPKFCGLAVDDYWAQITRIWKDFPACSLAVLRMDADAAQIGRFLRTLLELQQLGLKVETLPVWHLLQKDDDGEFFIPHIPQNRQSPFPCDFLFWEERLTESLPEDKSPIHLFSPSDEIGDHRAFQFQLGSLIWRLLAGAWPYDKEPLLSIRETAPNRVPYDFGEELTPVLERMTSLEPADRYDDLRSALEALSLALPK